MKKIVALGVVASAFVASLLVGCAGTTEKPPDVPDVIKEKIAEGVSI
ncbi:hypothetical protein ES703_120065 [subsurface metagenome]